MPPKDSKDKKEAPKGGLAPSSDIFVFLGTFIIVGAFLTTIVTRLTSGRGIGGFFADNEFFYELRAFYESFKVLSGLLSIIFACIIAYLVREINQIRDEEKKALYPEKEETKVEVMNKKWQRVIDHLESENESDWKLAVIEADILLDEMLDGMGYHGDTIGDKLKQIEKSDFLTLDKAWEAHKVRNQIAHQGASFVLTKKEAFRVISLYKDVFQEFYFI